MIILIWLLKSAHSIAEGVHASSFLLLFNFTLNHLLEVGLELGLREKVV